jgi:hypothetical protein
MRCAVHSLIGAAVLGLLPVSAFADTIQCLLDTGYAFVGEGGAATANGNVVFVFPQEGTPAFCDPPHFDLVVVAAGGDAGVVDYVAGTGLSLATGGIATPDLSGPAQGHIRVQQIFTFTLVPDDPTSNDMVPLTITSRHSFGRVRVGSSGFASSSNSHSGFYSLHLDSPTGSRIGSTWSSEGVIPTEDTSFDVVHEEELVFVNLKLVFVASINQKSWASASNGAMPGGAEAEMSSTVTYLLTTDSDTSIVFDMETLAGIPAPALDVVSVPEPDRLALGLVSLASLTCLVGLRRRSAGMPGWIRYRRPDVS